VDLGPVCDRAVESWHLLSSLGVWTHPVNSYGAEIWLAGTCGLSESTAHLCLVRGQRNQEAAKSERQSDEVARGGVMSVLSNVDVSIDQRHQTFISLSKAAPQLNGPALLFPSSNDLRCHLLR
jgi:hypothetical protein